MAQIGRDEPARWQIFLRAEIFRPTGDIAGVAYEGCSSLALRLDQIFQRLIQKWELELKARR
jgi:hypothetical protein